MYEFNATDVFDFANFIGAEVMQKGDELWFKYCPHCKGGGKDKETFSVNLKKGAFQCFRSSCDYHGHFVELARDFGFRLTDENEVQQYRKLPQKPIVTKAPAVKYMESRGISKEITEKYHITTTKDNDNVLVFPFYDEQKQLCFVKYRKTNFDKEKDKNKEIRVSKIL